MFAAPVGRRNRIRFPQTLTLQLYTARQQPSHKYLIRCWFLVSLHRKPQLFGNRLLRLSAQLNRRILKGDCIGRMPLCCIAV